MALQWRLTRWTLTIASALLVEKNGVKMVKNEGNAEIGGKLWSLPYRLQGL